MRSRRVTNVTVALLLPVTRSDRYTVLGAGVDRGRRDVARGGAHAHGPPPTRPQATIIAEPGGAYFCDHCGGGGLPCFGWSWRPRIRVRGRHRRGVVVGARRGK